MMLVCDVHDLSSVLVSFTLHNHFARPGWVRRDSIGEFVGEA